MKRIISDERLNFYISKYSINEIFESDMKKYMALFEFSKNEFICKAGEQLDYLFFFVEGKAKVYASLSDGKSLLLCFYNPFKVLGDVEFIKHETADCSVQVIDDAYCIGIAFADIRKYAIDDAKFLRFACNSLGEKLVRLSKYSSINLLYPLENRLSSYMLANTSNKSSEEGSMVVFEGNLSEVAEILGTSYRHLLRSLKELTRDGLIRKSRKGYEIVDYERLKQLAGDLYE